MTRIAGIVLIMLGAFVPLTDVQSMPEPRPSGGNADGTTEGGSKMRYGLFGKMTTRPGQRDAVVAILLRDVQELKAVGCDLYVVSISQDHPDVVWVTEVWASKDAHDASLNLPTVKQAIAEALPLLTGEFEHIEFSVVGGLGVPDGSSS